VFGVKPSPPATEDFERPTVVMSANFSDKIKEGEAIKVEASDSTDKKE